MRERNDTKLGEEVTFFPDLLFASLNSVSIGDGFRRRRGGVGSVGPAVRKPDPLGGKEGRRARCMAPPAGAMTTLARSS